MDLNTSQKDQLQQGLNQIGSTLLSTDKKKEIIEKAKHDLLDLFLDDTLGLENHDQVNKAFDHVQALLTDKIQEANNEITQAATEVEKAKSETKKRDFLALRSSAQRSQRTYNSPEKFAEKEELKGRMGQVKELYDKIAKINNVIKGDQEQENIQEENTITPKQVELTPTQQEGLEGFVTDTTDTINQEEEKEKAPQDSTIGEPEEKDYINELLEKIKFLKELNYLAAKCDKTPKSDTEELQKIREQYNTLLEKNINYAQDPQNKTDLEIQRQKNFIENKLGTVNTTEDIQEHTKKEILDLFTIDANVMDKENLIEESERNRIRDLSERKYMKANWLQKVGMFGIDRRRQDKKLKKSMEEQKNKSNFIEDGTLQNRIDGNIGTYASQTNMGIDGGKITRTEINNDDRINTIAHEFLMGDIDKDDAIAKFNTAFNNNSELRMGAMTGTDIMAQLSDSNYQQTYKINQLLLPFVGKDAKILSDTDIDQILKQVNPQTATISGNQVIATKNLKAKDIKSKLEDLKTMMLNKNIEQITENTSKIRVKLRGLTKKSNTEELEGVRYDTLEQKRREKVAKFFHRGSGLSMGAKIATGVTLGALGPRRLPVLGVTALGSGLQRAKTRRDTIKEMAKTQEDAINMGVEELDARIKALQEAEEKAQGGIHVLKFFGMGSYHRILKQLKILESFNSMREKGTIVSVNKIISDLNNVKTDITPLADTLARIKAGQHYQTHFISTTDTNGKSLGYAETAIKRNEMMKALQEACFRMKLIERRENITPSEWKELREKIQKTDSYKEKFKNLSISYEHTEEDIIINKGIIARNAAGNYAKSALAMSTAVAIGGGIINGLHGGSTTPGTSHEVMENIKPHEHTNYEIGKFDDHGMIDKTHTSGLDQVHNGQTIEIQGESAVDAIKAHSKNSFGNYLEHVNETRELISHSGLNKATQETLQNAISDDKIKDIMKIAADAGADEGNRKLVVERWREGMENITEHLSSHKMNDVTIKDIVFDTKTAKMAMQSSTGGSDVTHRGFEAIIKIVDNGNINKNALGAVAEKGVISFPRRFAPWIPATLPFANTYALPGEESDFRSLSPQAVEKRKRRWKRRQRNRQAA